MALGHFPRDICLSYHRAAGIHHVQDTAQYGYGDYEKFSIIDGKRYSHTIDPKTGFPVAGTKSVTIICNVAELADALTTPVMVMGLQVGINMINQVKGVACIILDEHDRLYTSRQIKLRTMMRVVLVLLVFTFLGFTSCQPVKEYQKNKLNDSEMQLSARKVQKFEQNFEVYREGASGANGGKTGGGCGCN